MFRFEAGPDDLLHSTFALSPSFELENLLRILSRRQVPGWAQRFVPAFTRLRRETSLHALLALGSRFRGPNFIAPPPERGMLQSIEDDLAAIRLVPLELARADIASCLAVAAKPSAEDLAVLHSPSVVQIAADTLELAWNALMASDWLQLRAICERDVVYRSGQLARHGWAAALDGLHESVSWHDGGIELSGNWEGTVSLGGQGLTFIPTVFVYPRVAMHYEEPWPKCLIYPARGIGTLWQRPSQAPEALRELIGRTRAQILMALASPASTTQLARSLSLATGSTNDHLRALQRAGLLESARDGRSVLYQRTPLGDMLAGS